MRTLFAIMLLVIVVGVGAVILNMATPINATTEQPAENKTEPEILQPQLSYVNMLDAPLELENSFASFENTTAFYASTYPHLFSYEFATRSSLIENAEQVIVDFRLQINGRTLNDGFIELKRRVSYDFNIGAKFADNKYEVYIFAMERGDQLRIAVTNLDTGRDVAITSSFCEIRQIKVLPNKNYEVFVKFTRTVASNEAMSALLIDIYNGDFTSFKYNNLNYRVEKIVKNTSGEIIVSVVSVELANSYNADGEWQLVPYSITYKSVYKGNTQITLNCPTAILGGEK